MRICSLISSTKVQLEFLTSSEVSEFIIYDKVLNLLKAFSVSKRIGIPEKAVFDYWHHYCNISFRRFVLEKMLLKDVTHVVGNIMSGRAGKREKQWNIRSF